MRTASVCLTLLFGGCFAAEPVWMTPLGAWQPFNMAYSVEILEATMRFSACTLPYQVLQQVDGRGIPELSDRRPSDDSRTWHTTVLALIKEGPLREECQFGIPDVIVLSRSEESPCGAEVMIFDKRDAYDSRLSEYSSETWLMKPCTLRVPH